MVEEMLQDYLAMARIQASQQEQADSIKLESEAH